FRLVRHRCEEIGQEEEEQGPVVDQQGRAEAGLAGGVGGGTHAAAPAMARAARAGSKGRKSSMPSPTPMAWMGRPYFSAAATSTPPRAVPSSLVITSPVTPATSRNTSIWESAFWPVVASSTSTTSS